MNLVKKLYVIGNGFDLAHGLPTAYWDFRSFLEKRDWDFLVEFETLYGFPQIDESDPYVNVKMWKEELKKVLWNSLEENMAEPDVSSILNTSDSIVGQLDLDGGNIGIEDTMNAYWKDRFSFIKTLPQYVSKWIENVEHEYVLNAKPRNMSMIGESNSRFITFNYTSTLETCYHIDDKCVTHIHGSIMPYSDNMPIMGHGYKIGVYEHRQKAREADNQFDEGRKSIENAIANIYNDTIKDTDVIIRENEHVFRKLNDIEQVIIVGLSYGNVDLPYLKKIKRCVCRVAKWEMYYYSSTDREQLEKVIMILDLDPSLVKIAHTNDFFTKC